MLIIKTPFRVSFFGGRTDIPAFFKKEGGHVIECAIKKYSYVTIKDLPPFYDHKIRLSYSMIERCINFTEIKHPILRAALADFKTENIEIHHDSELPGRSGIGSSSSFAVGLAHGLFAHHGISVNNSKISKKAIFWERDYLQEKGGYQDQLFAAYGGFNYMKFKIDGTYTVNKFPLSKEMKAKLERQALLCYVPYKRISSLNSIENHLQNKSTFEKLIKVKEFVDKSIILFQNSDINGLGNLLHESWTFKKSLPNVSNQIIEDVYEKAIKNGALGGKILGSGKGGFMLFICKEGSRDNLADALKPLINFPLEIENEGSKIIYFEK